MSRSPRSLSPVALFLCGFALLSSAVLFSSAERSQSNPERAAGFGDGIDMSAEVAEWGASFPPPEAEFEAGTATRKEDTSDIELERTDDGFTITMPTGAPIATPAVANGRLYASGGFSSQEFYCFDATTGETIWGVDLSDDGPSWAVVVDDSVIFNTESCTIFALDAKTGEHQWSWYLGDPLMSSPAVANGRVYAVYPVAESMGGLGGGGFGGGGFGGGQFAVDDPFSDSEPSPDPTEPTARDVEAMPELDPPEAATEEPTDTDGRPSHALACFDLETGKILWQRWVDSDCTSAPIVDGDDVYVATFTGALFRFDAADGTLDDARNIAATSAPVLVDGQVYVTRRAGETGPRKVAGEIVDGTPNVDEFIAVHSTRRLAYQRESFRCTAPWLDAEVQRHSAATGKANDFEAFNGIGGGFGGGFGGFQGEGGGGGFGGFSVDDPISDEDSDEPAAGEPVPQLEQVQFGQPPSVLQGSGQNVDPLVVTQQQAIDNLGLGNVSTLQGFQGSRLLHWNGRTFNTMGDRVVCTSAETGRAVWTRQLDGDVAEIGGHLGTPPVPAGEHLLVGTVDGQLLVLDRDSGELARSIEIGGEIRFAPTVADGRVYVGTQDGKIVCRSLSEATADWPQWGGNPAHTGVVAR